MDLVRIDIAAIITAISLIIGAAATFIIALRDRKSDGNSNAKAVAVTEIADTGKKVETLIQQVDFLFEEISRLRVEKDNLERKVAELTDELRREKEDHAKTKAALTEALNKLAEKTAKLEELEAQLVKKLDK